MQVGVGVMQVGVGVMKVGVGVMQVGAVVGYWGGLGGAAPANRYNAPANHGWGGTRYSIPLYFFGNSGSGGAEGGAGTVYHYIFSEIQGTFCPNFADFG